MTNRELHGSRNGSKAEAATRLIRCEPYCTRRNPMKELISTALTMGALKVEEGMVG
jgi:hypothetical protein